MTKRRRIYLLSFYHENDEQTTSEIHFQSLPFPYLFFHARKRAYGKTVGRGDTDGSLKVVRKKKILISRLVIFLMLKIEIFLKITKNQNFRAPQPYG